MPSFEFLGVKYILGFDSIIQINLIFDQPLVFFLAIVYPTWATIAWTPPQTKFIFLDIVFSWIFFFLLFLYNPNPTTSLVSPDIIRWQFRVSSLSPSPSFRSYSRSIFFQLRFALKSIPIGFLIFRLKSFAKWFFSGLDNKGRGSEKIGFWWGWFPLQFRNNNMVDLHVEIKPKTRISKYQKLWIFERALHSFAMGRNFRL